MNDDKAGMVPKFMLDTLDRVNAAASFKPTNEAGDSPVQLQHMAVAENGVLRWMSGRKADNCELYAMPDFGPAPLLWTAPSAKAVAADRTLQRLGYTWNGGALWKPPLGDVARAMKGAVDRAYSAAGLTPFPGETACSFRNRILAQADIPLETSEDEAWPYRAGDEKAGQVVDADYWAGDEEAIRKALVELDDIATAHDRYELGLPLWLPEQHEKLAEVLRKMLAKQRADLAQAHPAEMSAAARDVLAERRRQQEVEGWAPEHDDMHSAGELALGAAFYAANAFVPANSSVVLYGWPWHPSWYKKTTPRRDLEKAGALIQAEIERLDRAAEKGGAA